MLLSRMSNLRMKKKFKKIGKNLQKKLDFCMSFLYTVATWSKMVVKWSKVEGGDSFDR